MAHSTDPHNCAGKCGGDRGSEDVVIANMREFVSDDAFKFVVIHEFEQALRDSNRCMAGVAAGGERVGSRLRDSIQLRHRQIGFPAKALHHCVETRRLFSADWLRATGSERDFVGEEIGDSIH